MEGNLNERTWNFLTQQFAKNNRFNEEAIYWFERIIKERRLAKANIYTLHAMMKVFSMNGDVDKCEEILNELEIEGKSNVFSYIYFVKACIENEDSEKAFDVIDRMERNHIEPNYGIYIPLLKLATSCRNKNVGMKLIGMIRKSNLESHQLSGCIANFGLKLGMPEIAIKEYEMMKKTMNMDVIDWTCLIQAYIQNNEIGKAIETLGEMSRKGSEPDSTTFTILLTACANTKQFKEGMEIYEMAKKNLKQFPLEFTSSLINFYTKCGHYQDAIRECQQLKEEGLMDIVMWTCLIQAHVQNNDIQQAIKTLSEMKQYGIVPDSKLFTIMLSACASSQRYDEGVKIHQMAKQNLKKFPIEFSNSVINFYTKCGHFKTSIEEGENLIGKGSMDVVTFNCLIQAHIHNNEISKAINLLFEMEQYGIEPDSTSFIILLTACANTKNLEEGIHIHETAKIYLKEFPIELSSTIINFYTKCGNPLIAIQESEKIRERGLMDIVAWTCLIQAYLQTACLLELPPNSEHGLNDAYSIYQEMKRHSEPDITAYVVLLSACGEYVASKIGLDIIQDITQAGMDNSEEVISSMLFFYSRIGHNDTAKELFERMQESHRNGKDLTVATYGHMLSCYAQHGKVEEARKLFNEMIERNVELNQVIFTILLTAYSHSGMVDEAIQLYNDMKVKHNIHSNRSIDCIIVDAYSRTGRFEDALSFIGNRMDIEMWGALMGGCRKFNNMELGEKVFEIMTSIDEKAPSPYLLLLNIYSFHEMNEKVSHLRELMEERGIKKIPGIITYEENGKVYQFISGSQEYDRKLDVDQMRDEIYCQIAKAGFKPDTRCVTNTKLNTEEKLHSLGHHAEKTAIAHALVLNPNRKQILLSGNLRVCNDCHEAIAFISKVKKVEVILRDASRYHNFKDGKCTCGDRW